MGASFQLRHVLNPLLLSMDRSAVGASGISEDLNEISEDLIIYISGFLSFRDSFCLALASKYLYGICSHLIYFDRWGPTDTIAFAAAPHALGPLNRKSIPLLSLIARERAFRIAAEGQVIGLLNDCAEHFWNRDYICKENMRILVTAFFANPSPAQKAPRIASSVLMKLVFLIKGSKANDEGDAIFCTVLGVLGEVEENRARMGLASDALVKCLRQNIQNTCEPYAVSLASSSSL